MPHRRRMRGGADLGDRFDAVRMAAGYPPIGAPYIYGPPMSGFGKKRKRRQRGGLPFYRRRHGKEYRRDLYPQGSKPLGKEGLYAKWVRPDMSKIKQLLLSPKTNGPFIPGFQPVIGPAF